MAHLLGPQADILADDVPFQTLLAREEHASAGHPAGLVARGASLPAMIDRRGGRRIACIGGAALFRCYIGGAPIRFGISNPVSSLRGFAGVARNVAERLALLGVPVSLASMVGEDAAGQSLIRHLQSLQIDTGAIRVSASAVTAEYAAIVGPDRELVLGLADMAIIETISLADLDRWWPQLAAAAWVFADCNLAAPVLAACAAGRRDAAFRLAVDAVSVPKVARLPRDMRGIDLLIMNELEAEALLAARCGLLCVAPHEAAERLRDLGAATVIINLAERGLVVADADGLATVPAEPGIRTDIRGDGDALVAGTLFRLLEGDDIRGAVRFAARYAACSSDATRPVPAASMLGS